MYRLYVALEIATIRNCHSALSGRELKQILLKGPDRQYCR